MTRDRCTAFNRNPIPAKIEIQPTRIDIFFTDDRSVWIEREGGDIKVRCYGPKSGEPTSISKSTDTLNIA